MQIVSINGVDPTVFGAGIAGLSAAHEFVRLGYTVSVYEVNRDAGGFFRSARRNSPSRKLESQ